MQHFPRFFLSVAYGIADLGFTSRRSIKNYLSHHVSYCPGVSLAFAESQNMASEESYAALGSSGL